MRLPFSNEFTQRMITGLFLGIGFWAVFFYLPPICFSLVLLLILILILLFEWTQFFPINQPAFWILMPIYLLIPFYLLVMLNHNPIHRELLFLLFILVFSFDTGSYIVGTFFGKHYISKTISPKKTWEGLIGGYLFACIGFMAVIFEGGYRSSPWIIAGLTAIICLLSFAGDLFESWLKRRAHLKDSGTLLPGHGGFLDRFDGIIFAVFFFYLFRETLATLLLT